ncbi:MAG: hypothetical protein PHQ53_04565 [Candidatus Krumholzibacteria bacterium]|nr:hypothetical protein [Candidatus Krumholzibacteria bacterium]
MNELTRTVTVLIQLGVAKTSIAKGTGLNPADLNAMIDGSAEPTAPAMLKLERFARETIEAKFASAAQAISFDGGGPLLARAMLPSVRRLAAALEAAESRAASAAGWPAPIPAGEIDARVRACQVAALEAEGREAAIRAETESGSAW